MRMLLERWDQTWHLSVTWAETGGWTSVTFFFLPQQSDHILTAVTSVNVIVREKPSDKLKIAIVHNAV